MSFLYRFSKRCFTYKYDKFFNPNKFLKFNSNSIKPESINIEIKENLCYFRTYSELKDENLFFRYILFYDFKDNLELFDICEILFKLSRDEFKQKLVYKIFSRLLYSNINNLKEEDFVKLEKLLTKSLFQRSVFSGIIKDAKFRKNSNTI
jgi:hypothetical protein